MSKKRDTFPARLHGIFARDKTIAILFRRGPSKQVATFLWDLNKDTFQLGQWLKGRIYERRADISPDGQHMIYFAMNGKLLSNTRGSWTAISRPPYLKAIDLFAKGDCWEGGGLFLSNEKYWLNDRYFGEAKALFKKSNLVCDTKARPAEFFGSECTGVYYPRLIRDGWKLIRHSERGKWNTVTIFEKPLSKGWTLRKIAHEQIGAPKGKGCYWDEHELENNHSGVLIRRPDWEWADWERNRLVWAENGNLFSAHPSKMTAEKSKTLLHDFTPSTFEFIEAPY